ncbi:MAG: membrane-associated phospholipid phosphatase [Bacteroidia bacterium]|jgi:membrane-associated phospholipid phosphatase
MRESFFYKRRLLFTTWLICFTVGVVIALITEKGDTILYLNNWYNSFTVPVFSFFTRMGEAAGFLVPFLYFLIFKPVKFQLGHLLVGLTTLILVYFFKHVVYPDSIRPIVFFEQLNIDLLNRSDITLNRKFSFPSGHTAAGFAYFFYAALCADKRVFTMVFFSTALLIGVSRIFLAQHFVLDVLAGSTLGVAIATVVYFYVIYKSSFSSPFLDKKLFHGKA